MSLDFRASQIQANKLIASGSTGTETGAQIVVYSHLADDGAAPNQGFIDQTKFVTSSIGTDIFLYVSGGIGQRLVGGSKAISVFGGDLHVSGNFTVGGSYPSGGGGGGSSEYWFSSGSGEIATTGSVAIVGNDYPTKDQASDYGSNVFFYVSGNKGEDSLKKAVFGGTTFISGNIQIPFATKIQARNLGSTGWLTVAQYLDATGIGYGNQVLVIGDNGGSGVGIAGSIPGAPIAIITGSNQGFFSGSYKFPQGLSGSLTKLTDGSDYLLAGPNVTLTTNSLGQIEISGSASGGSSFYRLEVLDYYSTNATSDTTAGQVIFPANQFTGSLVLQGVISNQLSNATASIQLYNITSGSYVEIGGVGITYLSVSGTTPTIVTSVDLISASNFNSSSQAIYELQVSSSNGASYAFFGGFELKPSGSFTGNTYISASNNYYYVSGTWEDGGNKLATTASVALAGNLGPGYFADNVGSDVYFFVSGNNGGVVDGSGVAVFAGDIVISGVVYGGSPLKISGSLQQGYQNSANGNSSHAEGSNVRANGSFSHAEGENSRSGLIGFNVVNIDTVNETPNAIFTLNSSYGDVSFTTDILTNGFGLNNPVYRYGYVSSSFDGTNTHITASNVYNAPGYLGTILCQFDQTYASVLGGEDVSFGGYASHTEGYQTLAYAVYSHAEGRYAVASGYASHAEGNNSEAAGNYSHAEGYTYASGPYSHAEGYRSWSSGSHSHAEGDTTQAQGIGSHAEGITTIASGDYSHAEGDTTQAQGFSSHAEGYNTIASGSYSHAEGITTIASGDYSHAEGDTTQAQGLSSHAEGYNTIASGSYSHAEGINTIASGDYSHAEGENSESAAGISHVEGSGTYASGIGSHAEGFRTWSSGEFSHAQGLQTIASGSYSHAEGGDTEARGEFSHAQGLQTIAIGDYSHVGGRKTIASGSAQTVFGKYNKRNNTDSLFIIGNGDGDADSNRSDIVLVNSESIEFKKDLYITGSLIVSGTIANPSTINQYGGLRYYPTIITSLPYTASLNEYILAVSASAGSGIELPVSEYGRTFIIKDVSGSATTDSITITAAGGELIDGLPNATLGIDYGSYKLIYFGSGIGWGVV